MEALFNNSTVFIFFFAMIAIFNYSDLKVKQRICIIYVSVYALIASGIIGLKTALILLLITLFCYLEILTEDQMKFKLLVNPIYKFVDCLYLSFSQYCLLPVLLSLLCFYYRIDNWMGSYAFLIKIISLPIFAYSIIRVLQERFLVATFDKMYSVFENFPINKVVFNEKLDEANSILVSVEDNEYFERKQYTNFNLSFILRKMKALGVKRSFSRGKNFVGNIVSGNRGYSTIPMQLIRSIGILSGYTCTFRRKIFELLYVKMFFDGLKNYYEHEVVFNRENIKDYYLYIYFHTVEMKLGDANFSKFLNAFDMKYDQKNDKDIYDCTNEGIFIACMGLSHRATRINEDTVDYYTRGILVELDKNLICDMVARMMDKPYDGNYLK